MAATDDRVAVVTGASQGIGRAAALKFAQEGWTVYGLFRGTHGFAESRSQLRQEGVRALKVDVTDERDVELAVDHVLHASGRVDALINAAGFGAHGPWESFTAADLRRQLETNLIGVFTMCRAVAPSMRERGSGVMVNIGSQAALRTGFWESVYSASKYGMLGLSLGMRIELRQFGVNVCTVNPGWYSATDYGNAMIATDELASGTGPYGDLIRAFTRNRPGREVPNEDLGEVTAAIWQAVSEPDPPFAITVGCQPFRTETDDRTYEALVFDAYDLKTFASPRGRPRD